MEKTKEATEKKHSEETLAVYSTFNYTLGGRMKGEDIRGTWSPNEKDRNA